MKSYFWAIVLCAGLVLHGCGESLLDSRYTVELPELPQSWDALLGGSYWRIEWLNSEGRIETMTIRGDTTAVISLPPTWISAVSAAPFWPDRGLWHGIFRPAGAIFPYDASGKRLILSWQGGVEANLFWELARAYADQEAPAPTAVPRLPQNFDWPRFRLLFDPPSSEGDLTVNEALRADPWLADWPGIAAKIVRSGFDRRRLVPEARGSLAIPVGRGPWIGTSPFAAPLLFEAEPVFPVRSAADTWVSGEGILRCSTEAWIFIRER